ncbi:hypothetical protein HDE69_004793 [Pedobacter cryoconitis]|uniref:Uncharacterized protein n=1 Tax=Pedobacter cryoconitis TaxID=188932 RepID=A0A7W9DLV4_9SPHI|nr:hypothetical protein [Pedobacter cryoconitis]MBB5623706.1 hypothetical protein [Pedobacter cryoconitis]
MLGQGNQNYLPVLSGLNAGDIVVISEAIFKNGNDKMDMGNMKM